MSTGKVVVGSACSGVWVNIENMSMYILNGKQLQTNKYKCQILYLDGRISHWVLVTSKGNRSSAT